MVIVGHLTRYYGAEEEVQFSKSQKFKVETFLPVLDSLICELKKRAEAYSMIGNLFSFFSELTTISSDELNIKCSDLAQMYHQDIYHGELLNECLHLKKYIVIGEESGCQCPSELYKRIISECLKRIFPNVEISLRIFVCMMVTNCTGERSFSRLKLIKNELYARK